MSEKSWVDKANAVLEDVWTLRLDFHGNPIDLAFTTDRYQADNSLAIQAWNMDKGSPDIGSTVELFDDVTRNVGLAGGNLVNLNADLDANKALIGALEGEGMIELTDRADASGFGSYPEAIVTDRFLQVMDETQAAFDECGRLYEEACHGIER